MIFRFRISGAIDLTIVSWHNSNEGLAKWPFASGCRASAADPSEIQCQTPGWCPFQSSLAAKFTVFLRSYSQPRTKIMFLRHGQGAGEYSIDRRTKYISHMHIVIFDLPQIVRIPRRAQRKYGEDRSEWGGEGARLSFSTWLILRYFGPRCHLANDRRKPFTRFAAMGSTLRERLALVKTIRKLRGNRKKSQTAKPMTSAGKRWRR